MALLRSSPFFLKAPLRGEGRAARCLLAECLWSSCRQAGRTSWSRTLQAGCGVHPLPGGRQQLAQGARRTGGRLRLTAYQRGSKAAGSITDQRERKPVDARLRRGIAVEGEKSGPIQNRRTKAAIFFSKSAAARRRARCAAARSRRARCASRPRAVSSSSRAPTSCRTSTRSTLCRASTT